MRRTLVTQASAGAGLLLAAALALLGALVPASASAVAASSPPVPVLRWTDCGGGFRCATAAVPLDYAHPRGRTISLALVKLPATDPAHRIGSLFINPGGPGSSGVQFVQQEGSLFPAELRARFDLVGFDPRGVGASTPVRCFGSVAEQQAFLGALPAFPVGPAEEQAWSQAWTRFGELCEQRSAGLLPHLSTADAARDMDLLRRAVGDSRLSYFGISYGSYLGTTYVNLFPGRVRAVALDGIVEPVEWATGRGDEAETLPYSTRLRSAEGSFATLQQFLDLCAAGGVQRCAFAAGSARATSDKFNALLQALRENPMVVAVPGGTITATYATAVSLVSGAMHDPTTWPLLATVLQAIDQRSSDAGPDLLALRQLVTAPASGGYDNTTEASVAISCADTDNPSGLLAWPAAAHEADRRAPYFGSLWTFISQPCATWPVRDTDRYAGPWNRPTSSPVLVVGNLFDPATRYESAVSLSHELARGRLLTVAGWGHTSLAAGSTCSLQYETRYLLTGALPPAGTVCPVDQVPFAAGS